MTFQRHQDKIAKRTSRGISQFAGSHYGYGKTDQPDDFAYVCDFIVRNKKLTLRDGSRKNQEKGYSSSITSMFQINLGGGDFVGTIQNGSMSAYPVDDILDGKRKYYIWDEVNNTWSTWQDLQDGVDNWGSLMTDRNP